MALLSSFRGPGRCSHCGREVEIRVESHLGSRGLTYHVGDDVSADVNLADIEMSSFLVRAPADGEPIHVLSAWSCDACGAEGFVELVFAEGRLAELRAVELTLPVLERLHFVEESHNDMIEAITGHSMWDDHGVWPGWLAVLRAKLGGPPAPPDSAPVVTRKTTPPDEFPFNATLANGRYRPDHHYLGGGADQLFFGRDEANPGVRFLFSIAPDNGLDAGKLAPELMRAAPGLFVPRFVGPFDAPAAGQPPRGEVAFIEQLPAGSPIRLGAGDLRPHAAYVGHQVARTVLGASAAGILDVGLRPEYVWMVLEGGRPTVTGVGGRNHAFFSAAARRRDLPTARLFTHRYVAPEVYRGEPADDRALVLTIAVMVAEWITGAYPYEQGDGAWGYNRLCAGNHVPLPGPAPLVALLQAALRPGRDERPDLATFTRALADLAG